MYKTLKDDLENKLSNAKKSDNRSKLTKEELNDLNNPISNNNAKFSLSTKDNPFDPFTQFRDWFMFDVQKGYNSCSYLARIAKVSDQLSETENNFEIERAIDEILSLDFTKNYIKVINKNYKDINTYED